MANPFKRRDGIGPGGQKTGGGLRRGTTSGSARYSQGSQQPSARPAGREVSSRTVKGGIDESSPLGRAQKLITEAGFMLEARHFMGTAERLRAGLDALISAMPGIAMSPPGSGLIKRFGNRQGPWGDEVRQLLMRADAYPTASGGLQAEMVLTDEGLHLDLEVARAFFDQVKAMQQ